MKPNMKTASLDRDGRLSINETFNYRGSVVKLKEILESAIEEFGTDVHCKLDIFRSFPNICSTQIIITNKTINIREQDEN